MSDQPWADEESIPEGMRQSLYIKHVDGPLFFGFASQFLDISRQLTGGKMLVLRMDRITYMDQTGIYALQEALVRLKAAGLRVLIVGITDRASRRAAEFSGDSIHRSRGGHLRGFRATQAANFPLSSPGCKLPRSLTPGIGRGRWRARQSESSFRSGSPQVLFPGVAVPAIQYSGVDPLDIPHEQGS